jgi:hypothetical protein
MKRELIDLYLGLLIVLGHFVTGGGPAELIARGIPVGTELELERGGLEVLLRLLHVLLRLFLLLLLQDGHVDL